MMVEPTPCTLACAFSPSGAHLACSTASGCLHIYSLADGETHPVLVASVQAHPPGCAIYSIAFTQSGTSTLLLTGSDDDIRGWRFEDLLSLTVATTSLVIRCVPAPAPVLQLQSPCQSLRRNAVSPVSETSALSIDASTGTLYSASGDGNAYAWDLKAQRYTPLEERSGHSWDVSPQKKSALPHVVLLHFAPGSQMHKHLQGPHRLPALSRNAPAAAAAGHRLRGWHASTLGRALRQLRSCH